MIITNFSNYSEFKIDESSLKQCVRKHFYKIKRPVYIEVDKKLERAYGMQTVLYLKDYENHSQHWTPNFIKEVESKDNYFHRIKLSYESSSLPIITYYQYETKYPHAGAGTRVRF